MTYYLLLLAMINLLASTCHSMEGLKKENKKNFEENMVLSNEGKIFVLPHWAIEECSTLSHLQAQKQEGSSLFPVINASSSTLQEFLDNPDSALYVNNFAQWSWATMLDHIQLADYLGFKDINVAYQALANKCMTINSKGEAIKILKSSLVDDSLHAPLKITLQEEMNKWLSNPLNRKWEQLYTIEIPNTTTPPYAFHSSKTPLIATGQNNKSIRRIQPHTNKIIALPCTEAAVSLAFNPAGTLLASAHRVGKVKIWDIEHSKIIQTLEKPKHVAQCIAFDPNNLFFIIGWANGLVEFREAHNLSNPLYAINNTYLPLIFTFDRIGKKMAIGSAAQVKIISLTPSPQVQPWALDFSSPLKSLHFNPFYDKEIMVSTGQNKIFNVDLAYIDEHYHQKKEKLGAGALEFLPHKYRLSTPGYLITSLAQYSRRHIYMTTQEGQLKLMNLRSFKKKKKNSVFNHLKNSPFPFFNVQRINFDQTTSCLTLILNSSILLYQLKNQKLRNFYTFIHTNEKTYRRLSLAHQLLVLYMGTQILPLSSIKETDSLIHLFHSLPSGLKECFIPNHV